MNKAKQTILRLPLLELFIAISVGIMEYFGNIKAGANHHLKARRMQLLKNVLSPYRYYLIITLVLLILFIVYLLYKKYKAKGQLSSALKLEIIWTSLDFILLIAMLLGFLQKSLLSYTYLLPALFVAVLIRLISLRNSLSRDS